MSDTGNSVVTSILLGGTIAIFVPVFADAASEFSGSGWKYAPYLQTVLDQLPLIAAVFAIVLIGGAIVNAY